MHHKVKDLGEDYRARLIKYVEDIAVSTPRWGQVYLMLNILM